MRDGGIGDGRWEGGGLFLVPFFLLYVCSNVFSSIVCKRSSVCLSEKLYQRDEQTKY